MFKFVVLAIAITAVHCQYGGYQKQEAEYKEEEYYDPPKYNFEYSVHDPHTGDIKSQKEQREGEHTQGEYKLVEPDGSVREIHYTVEGKSGFLAEVQKQGGKGYEQPSYYKPQPSYQKAEPSYYKPQPSYQKAEPSYYKPQPSYQKAQPSYYKPSYKPSY
ncbi:cuticle protein 7 [Halyomorpha halys]|uniref:cuticle protein 7 n=1 Tax=Halyomorpha halys TaxID=286706 RepID=UPI000D0C9275|nr:cuticle protein 7 [Halyomorpha halys]KAE8573780.1 Cuticle Protein CPR RR-2 [Halyomorpha halys]